MSSAYDLCEEFWGELITQRGQPLSLPNNHYVYMANEGVFGRTEEGADVRFNIQFNRGKAGPMLFLRRTKRTDFLVIMPHQTYLRVGRTQRLITVDQALEHLRTFTREVMPHLYGA